MATRASMTMKEMQDAQSLVTAFEKDIQALPFKVPVVSPVLELDDADISEIQMDLPTIKKKLNANKYKSFEGFFSEFRPILTDTFKYVGEARQKLKLTSNKGKKGNSETTDLNEVASSSDTHLLRKRKSEKILSKDKLESAKGDGPLLRRKKEYGEVPIFKRPLATKKLGNTSEKLRTREAKQKEESPKSEDSLNADVRILTKEEIENLKKSLNNELTTLTENPSNSETIEESLSLDRIRDNNNPDKPNLPCGLFLQDKHYKLHPDQIKKITLFLLEEFPVASKLTDEHYYYVSGGDISGDKLDKLIELVGNAEESGIPMPSE